MANHQPDKHNITHSEWHAIQYDLYIPAAIWNAQPVQALLKRLLAVNEGATVLNDLTGIWQGDVEETRIYRLILRVDEQLRDAIRDAFRREVEKLMVELSTTKQSQQAFLFTETDIRMNVVEMP